MVAAPVHMVCVCHTLTGLDGNWNSQHRHLCVRHEDSGLVTNIIHSYWTLLQRWVIPLARVFLCPPLKSNHCYVRSISTVYYVHFIISAIYIIQQQHRCCGEFVMKYGCVCVFRCVPLIGMTWTLQYTSSPWHCVAAYGLWVQKVKGRG